MDSDGVGEIPITVKRSHTSDQGEDVYETNWTVKSLRTGPDVRTGGETVLARVFRDKSPEEEISGGVTYKDVPYDTLLDWQPKPEPNNTENTSDSPRHEQEATPLTPEASEAIDTRIQDVEMLSKRYKVRKLIDETAATAASYRDDLVTTGRIIRDTPELARRAAIEAGPQARHSVVKGFHDWRIDSHRARMDANPNQSKTAQRYHERRIAKHEAKNEKSQAKLDLRKNAVQEQKNRIFSHSENAANAETQRRAGIEQNIQKYAERSAEARARKAVRRKLWEEGDLNFIERRIATREHFKENPKAFRSFGVKVIESAVHERRAQATERTANRADQKDRNTWEKIAQSYNALRGTDRSVREIDSALNNLHTVDLPKAAKRISEAMQAHRNATINDDIQAINQEIKDARQFYDNLANTQAVLEERRSQALYAKSRAEAAHESSRTRKDETGEKLNHAQLRHEKQKRVADTARRQRDDLYNHTLR